MGTDRRLLRWYHIYSDIGVGHGHCPECHALRNRWLESDMFLCNKCGIFNSVHLLERCAFCRILPLR